MNPADRLLQTRNLTKSFLGVKAVQGVSLEFSAGSIHALMGENGAGKSTIGKMLAGLIAPDSGEILFEGKQIAFRSPRDAQKAGVHILHQELAAFPNLTVAENLVIERLASRLGFLNAKARDEEAQRCLELLDLQIDLRSDFGKLSPGFQQLVLLARILSIDAKVVVFDEPTSSLTEPEVQLLFQKIRLLRDKGVCCIYVSHRMKEIFELCDTVTVLRDGQFVDSRPVDEFNSDSLIEAMTGRKVALGSPKPELGGKEPILVATRLTGEGFKQIDLTVAPGEVVGIAGLVGSGRTELLEGIFGLRATAGELEYDGSAFSNRSPAACLKKGLGLLPEDRKVQGLILELPILSNMSLSSLKQMSKFGFIERSTEEEKGREVSQELLMKADAGLDAPAGHLSGGNQQKVVLARLLMAQCKLLMLDEPTRGVDVGAKQEIHRVIQELVAEGKGVLVVSSELPEILALCNRIYVMREGAIVAEYSADQASETVLLNSMAGLVAI